MAPPQMMLPNPERVIVDLAKLREYCLCLDHPRGRHKARVFATALGLTAADAELLRDAPTEAARSERATLTKRDIYGMRFVLDFRMHGPAGEAIVRSLWIVRRGEVFARLTSCYVRHC